MTRVFLASCALILSLAGAHAQAVEPRTPSAAPPSRVSVVYVTDFQLDADAVKSPSGVLPGPVGQVMRGGVNALKPPAERAHELVELMAKTLTNSLNGEGVNARRLGANEPTPKDGWIVRGVFTKVEQGSRFERAAIGLGAGGTDLTVVVSVEDPKAGNRVPLEDIIAGAQSSKMIGAAPMAVIRFNPATVAAKFVLSSRDLEKNVVRTAMQISSKIVEGARKQP